MFYFLELNMVLVIPYLSCKNTLHTYKPKDTNYSKLKSFISDCEVWEDQKFICCNIYEIAHKMNFYYFYVKGISRAPGDATRKQIFLKFYASELKDFISVLPREGETYIYVDDFRDCFLETVFYNNGQGKK